MVIAFLFNAYSNLKKGVAEGYVYDCSTNQPIDNANVSLSKSRGWGFWSALTGDETHSYHSLTDSSGFFLIKYMGSPTQLQSEKSGYLVAEQWEKPSKNITIKMLEGDRSGSSYYCKLQADCKQTTIEDGVQVIQNTCNSYE